MEIEEEYQDVLQNIEFAIVEVYREDPMLLDYDVLEGLEALRRYYQAQERQRPAPSLRLFEQSQRVFDRVKGMCEWRLGRVELVDGQGEELEVRPEPLRVEEIGQCLKRIHQSVQRWNKLRGRRGYLDFVSPFIG